MAVALKLERRWTADEFMVADQRAFGDAWRYELVDGTVIAHAAPAPDHGAIASGITRALGNRLAGMPGGCRPEVGNRRGAAVRAAQHRPHSRRDGALRRAPRVAFEVVSPSEIRDWRGRDLKRQNIQAVEGMQEIVEVYQDDYAVHVYRLLPSGAWAFEALGGEDAALRLDSLGFEIPLAEIYAFVSLPRPAEAEPAP